MIDFPASPTDGQVFSATNGVVYRWSATYTSWLAQTAPPVLGGTGEVTATRPSGSVAVAGSDTVIPINTVTNGNAGLWFNTTNNRYTPPAGKYFITFSVTYQGGPSAIAAIALRKNGTRVGQYVQGQISAAAGFAPLTLGEYVDANGTDFFDFVENVVSGVSSIGGVFSAFPLTGIQGPTGGAPGPVVGDFAAAGTPSLGTTAAVMIMPVVNGNSGTYYNAATGRWTPPAGRYNIYGAIGAWSGVGGIGITAQFRKNGVGIPSVTMSVNTPGTNQWNAAPLETQVDANGTDYFELWGWTNPGATGSQAYFGAFPTQGMVGPQGPQGPMGPAVFRNYLSGFVHSSSGGTKILAVGGGQAADSTNAVWINLAFTTNKLMSAPWAAG